MQAYSNSIANPLELLQSCTKPSKYEWIWKIIMREMKKYNRNMSKKIKIGYQGPGAHFTKDLSIIIKIRWKSVYVAIYFLAIISLHRFAHDTRFWQGMCVKSITRSIDVAIV